MSSLNRNRLWWLATCVVFVACASAPPATPTKKKKKKKKKKRDEIALKKQQDADRNEEEEQPDKPAKKSKDKDDEEVAVVDDEVTVVDDDGETSAKKSKKDAQAEKKRKKEEAAEAAAEKKRKQDEAAAELAAEKKRKKEEAAEAAAEKKRKKDEEAAAAAEKKRKKQEVAEVEEEPVEEDEPKPKKGKKPEQVAAATKGGKKTGKAKKQADEEEIDLTTEEPVEEDEPKPVKKKPEKIAKAGKSKSGPAEVDMTSEEPTIDMEEDTAGSSLETRVDDEPPAGRVAAIPVPGVDDETEEASVTAEATPIGANPTVINERPLTLPEGKLSVHGGLKFGVLTLETMPGVKTSSTSTGLGLGVNYGTSANTEVGLDYTLGVSPGSAKGPLTVHGAYRALNGKLDMAVAAAMAVDFSDSVDPATMMTTTRTAFSLQVGAWARYRLSRKLSLFSGLPALPTSAVSLTKLSLPLQPQPYQLVIGLNDAGTIALDVPLGVAYQATPKIYAFGMLNLAHIRVANTVNAFLFKDFIPLSFGGFYSLDKLDFGVVFSDDLKQGTDYLRFDTVVRYSIK